DGTTGGRGPDWPVVAGAYAVLFLLGAVEAMIGSFQYSRVPRPVPVAALVRGMGWVITSFVLSMPVSNGSVIITATTPGKWYLYGGTLSVAAAVVASFVGGVRWAGRR